MRVLIVEAEEDERLRLAVVLRGEGLSVRAVASADEALGALAREGSAIQVALVDVLLPGLSGARLARLLKERWPALRVVLTSPFHLSPGQLARLDCDGSGYVDWHAEPAGLLASLRGPRAVASLLA